MALNNNNPVEQVVEQELRTAGLRVTPQRRAVLACLLGDESHPTAQEIYDRLAVDVPGISFATVYNTLSALTRAGRVKPLPTTGATRYDPNANPHHHAICDACGAVWDVPATKEAPLPSLGSFEIHRVERTYRGLCAACRSHAGSA